MAAWEATSSSISASAHVHPTRPAALLRAMP